MTCDVCHRERDDWAYFRNAIVCKPCIFMNHDESRAQQFLCIALLTAGAVVFGLLWWL